MKALQPVALLLIAAFAWTHSVRAQEDEPASEFVKDADPSNFDDLVVKSRKYSLVGFFAPVS
jgi:hypothetical protein